MNLRLTVLTLLLLAGTSLIAEEARKAGENPKAVLPPVRRNEALKSADQLLALQPTNLEALVEGLPDPFYPTIKRSREKKASEVQAVVPKDVLLVRAAESIKPQGTMLIGSEPYLLLDGKRYKAGDTIPVNVDGLGVQITVVSIQRNSYTLRLEDQELRREFK